MPNIGLYGAEYIPRVEHIQPKNPNAVYLNAPRSVAAIPPERVLAELPAIAHGR